MNEDTKFIKAEAFIATVARLFANEGDLLAVELLSNARPRFDFYTHDNWNEGFDIYDLILEVTLDLYTKISNGKQDLEKNILEKLQSVTQGHTLDHIQSVTVVLEVVEGGDWRGKAKEWATGEAVKTNKSSLSSTSNAVAVQPSVFKIPQTPINGNQVGVMMPFKKEYHDTYSAIKKSCKDVGFTAVRADDIWLNTTFIQDIFDIIYCSKIIIVDFSSRNPNVMYETGIAHTLGRHVIPITRNIEDVPSDLQHHRALVYLPNEEGYASLVQGLSLKLGTLSGREVKEK